MLFTGDPAPTFVAPSSVNANFTFDTIAGRYVVLSFFCTSQLAFSREWLEIIGAERDRFSAEKLVFFGVTVDADDRERLKNDQPGIIWFFDDAQKISRLYQQFAEVTVDGAKQVNYAPGTYVLDQMLRVVAAIPFAGTPRAHFEAVMGVVDSLPPLETLELVTPVLVIPNVFEPELCRTLIDYYNTHGGTESGFMRDVNGKTVAVYDHSHKKRADCNIEDQELVRATQLRLHRRVVPAIKQAFAFTATRIERHIVACYDSADGGHFNAHRDNTAIATAHRRFAVTMNLNAEEFEGGELRFPEFGRRTYKAPTGGAVVFSCSLLHEAQRVTAGRRYAFLPFLYDEEAAKIRQQTQQHLVSAPPPRSQAQAT